ncbi:PTB domain-containing engulfment adapter protein 1 [Bagarius yarrelli]|uniref:PTB domain-containing engulfment adapter protein 1 n=1 Tax=Bagarius yarrelli TaxID=175774 RepID=A0A556VBA8_BAGYA|nr:PTB domain-containing engulfment adapter protein 1 [Bagarius yarrelli]
MLKALTQISVSAPSCGPDAHAAFASLIHRDPTESASTDSFQEKFNTSGFRVKHTLKVHMSQTPSISDLLLFPVTQKAWFPARPEELLCLITMNLGFNKRKETSLAVCSAFIRSFILDVSLNLLTLIFSTDKPTMHSRETLVKHHVAYSAKAEEITVTIGQAFDLAYKMFLQSGGKEAESRKQIGNLQKRAGHIPLEAASTDVFDMLPFTPGIPVSRIQMCNGTGNSLGTDLFGAVPFDPFTCSPADFPPDVQSKLEEMQEGFKMGLTVEGAVFCLDQVNSQTLDV